MLLAAEDGITRPRTSATAATGPWRSPCLPASSTTRGRTGSSPRWPPPPAPAAAGRRWSAGGASGAAPPPGAATPALTGTAAGPSRSPASAAAVTDFFLEYDTGTEPLSRVTAKLAGYAALAARTGITTPVLFWLSWEPEPGGRRCTPGFAGPPPPGIRDAASAAQIPGVPVATAAPAQAPARRRAGRGGVAARWAAPARADGSPSSPPPGTPPRTVAARTARGRAARPAAWPGTRRIPPPPAWNAAVGEPLPGQDGDD